MSSVTDHELASRASSRARDGDLAHFSQLSFTGERERDLQTLCDYVAFSRFAKSLGLLEADERVARMRFLYTALHGEPRV